MPNCPSVASFVYPRRMCRLISFLALLLLSSFALAAAKLETIGPCTEAGVADAVKQALAPQGYRVTFDDGTASDIWLRATVPTKGAAPKDASGASYTLPESVLVGVMKLEKSAKDYRGQSVAPGVYTLRYELQPNDGDHLGTAPTRDFLLALPAAGDSDPSALMKFEQLVPLSKQAAHANHPSPWNLVAAEAKIFPSVFDDGQEHIVFAFRLKTDSGEIPMALVVHGTAAQ